MPSLKLTQELPKLNPRAIERALESFVGELKAAADPQGFYNQLVKAVASALIYKTPGNDFWMAEENGEVVGFVTASIVVDIDMSLTYWVASAWADKKYRGKAVIKESWERLRERARQAMCKHIVIVGARDEKAFRRFLGHGIHKYATLLKEDL